MQHLRRIARFPLMALGILALLAGLWGGLVRLGWPLPLLHPALPIAHGPLMVCGFLGTLIGVERAIALGPCWPYVAPLLTALAMLFGHAPIMLPALLGRTPTPYHPALYVPLLLLQTSLLLRVVGDVGGWWPGRQWGGLLNALAVLLFFLTLGWGLSRRGSNRG